MRGKRYIVFNADLWWELIPLIPLQIIIQVLKSTYRTISWSLITQAHVNRFSEIHISLLIVVYMVGDKENPYSIPGQNLRRILMFSDKTLTCRDCGCEFVFSASEQDFFAEKGFTNEPSRCPQCRSARKQQSRNGRGPRAPREMHPATCAACGAKTQVPFRPTGDRPVYCSDCFNKNRGY